MGAINRTEPTIDIDRDQPTGQSQPNRRNLCSARDL